MKATVLDVLMYLFDNYFEDCSETSPDHAAMREDLQQAGFGEFQIDKAFEWLENLAVQSESPQHGAGTAGNSLRLFSHLEQEKLDPECRGFILFLEQAGVLDGREREIVIDRVMALESRDVKLEELKWVVLMVLLNQPGKESAYPWLENFVMDDMNISLH